MVNKSESGAYFAGQEDYDMLVKVTPYYDIMESLVSILIHDYILEHDLANPLVLDLGIGEGIPMEKAL